MTFTLRNLAITVLIFFVVTDSHGQLTVSHNNSACPNQIVNVTASWPNVSITSLSLVIPGGGAATNNGNLGAQNTFTLRHPGPGLVNWTLYGTGTSINGPVTGTINFQIQINPPPALTITNSVAYCPGQTATIIADPGGISYNLAGPVQLTGNQSNVITLPNVGPGHNGTYTVYSIGSCTQSGVTSIQVAPANNIAVNTTSNVCQGASVSLVANTTNPPNSGHTWEWSHQIISNVIGNTSQIVLPSVLPADGGIYYIKGLYTFAPGGGVSPIQCPMSNSTTVNVVETNPVAASASPGNIICQGAKLTLNAQANKAVSYQWVGPAGFGPNTQPSPTINPVSPNNGGIYTVTAFFTNNFISCTTDNTVQVQVVAVSVPVIQGPSSVCEDNVVTLNATGGQNNYDWFGPGTQTTGATWHVVGTSNASGTYYLTARYGPGNMCSATSSIQLNVVTVNSVSVLPPNPVCTPDNGYLFSSAIGANSYLWEGPGGWTNPGANVVVALPTPSMSGIYTVTAFFGGGPGSIVCSSTNTVELEVHPSMTFTLPEYQQACYNASLTIPGPLGADSYTWTSSTGYQSNSRDVVFGSVQPNNSGSYTLQISLGPCRTTRSASIHILSPVQFTLPPKGSTICQGDTLILEAALAGGSENYAYWWNPAVYMDSPVGPRKVITPGGTVQYNLIAHDIACPHFSVSQVIDIIVKNAPQPTLNLTSSRGCHPMTLRFDAGTSDTAWVTTYDFGNGEQFRSEHGLNYTFPEPGTYTVKVISQGLNGCAGTYVYPEPIVVLPRPGADISWLPEVPSTSDEVVFYPAAKERPVEFLTWIFAGGEAAELDSIDVSPGIDTTQELNPRRRYHQFGKYGATLVVKSAGNECIDTVTKFFDVIDNLQIYIPNSFTPNDDGVNDEFFPKGQGFKTENYSMQITDRWNNEVFFTRDVNEKWDGTFKGAKVPDGVYFYKIRAVGMNGEGRREYIGHFSLLK